MESETDNENAVDDEEDEGAEIEAEEEYADEDEMDGLRTRRQSDVDMD